ncbi:MAG: cupin domain-containing protein [Dehalococcoidia bacterium]|nr:cupin domain-containing protein [Dehalococcoidia bacterium]
MSEEYVRASEEKRASKVVAVGYVPLVSLAEGIVTRIVPGDNLTLSFVHVSAHAQGKMHSHPHEQMIVVLEGKIDIVIEGEIYGLKTGEVIAIPGNVEHNGIAGDKDCQMLEIFTPARKDFEEKLRLAIAEQ